MPDEFQKLGQEAVPFLEKHGRPVALGVAGALVVGLLIALGTSMSGRGEEAASRDFGAALKVLERPVNANAATDGAAAKPGEPTPFGTEVEKDEAIIKSLTEFRTKHSGRKAAQAAALPLAQALLRRDRAEMALPLIEEYLAHTEANDVLKPAAIEARGYAFEAQKKYDDALSAFDQLAQENKTDFLKGMGQYHRGRILLLKGDAPAAAKAFSEIEMAAPNSAASRLAKDRVLALAARGVVVPKVEVNAAAIDAGK